jgi:hypothetical protein
LDKVLADCLEAIEEGRLTIEDCQRRYPRYREQLRRLLPLASTLRESTPVTPSPIFRRHARQRLLAKLPHHSQVHQPTQKKRSLADILRFPDRQAFKPAFQLLVILITVVTIGSGVTAVFASGETLPGDTFYFVKTVFEELQIRLTFDTAESTLVTLKFAQRRIGEMKSLAEKGRYEDIALAAHNYHTKLLKLNDSLRIMTLKGNPRLVEIGQLVEETLFYDTIILTGLVETVPVETQGVLEVAIGASKSGNAIARQWVQVAIASPSNIPTEIPEDQPVEEIGIPLPTDIACWPTDLKSEPPEGVPLCETHQTPVPLPEDLVLFCWPSQIPFNPPTDIPLCGEGEVPLPENLGLICWPRQVSLTPPPGLSLCEPGQLPIPLPSGFFVPCWPANIPFNAPPGIPTCGEGPEPTPAPEDLPCWPPELSPSPPPGMKLCDPGEWFFPNSNWPGLDGFKEGGVGDIIQNILTQMPPQPCWPSDLEGEPPAGMPVCQPE